MDNSSGMRMCVIVLEDGFRIPLHVWHYNGLEDVTDVQFCIQVAVEDDHLCTVLIRAVSYHDTPSVSLLHFLDTSILEVLIPPPPPNMNSAVAVLQTETGLICQEYSAPLNPCPSHMVPCPLVLLFCVQV